MTKELTRVTASLEDLTIGRGKIVQQRNGEDVTVTKIDTNWFVDTIQQLKLLDTAAINTVSLTSNMATYVYNSTSTVVADDDHVLAPSAGSGRWLKTKVGNVILTTVLYDEHTDSLRSYVNSGGVVTFVGLVIAAQHNTSGLLAEQSTKWKCTNSAGSLPVGYTLNAIGADDKLYLGNPDSSVSIFENVTGTFSTSDLADGSVTTTKIADDAITNALIADDAVDTAQIADDAITNALIADDAVDTAQIADDAITADLIANNAVGTSQLIDANVTTGKLANNSVTGDILHDSLLADRMPSAWIAFNGSGTISIRDSYNVSSIADNGTGHYTINFSTAMSNTNYCVVANAGWNPGIAGNRVVVINAYNTGSVKAYVTNCSTGGVSDPEILNLIVFGGS